MKREFFQGRRRRTLKGVDRGEGGDTVGVGDGGDESDKGDRRYMVHGGEEGTEGNTSSVRWERYDDMIIVL